MTREEWYVDSIGGGYVGTREQVREWIATWRAEHGDDYKITLQRRYINETPWVDIDPAELEGDGCPFNTPGCTRTDCSFVRGHSCSGPAAPRHIDMEDGC